MPGRGVGQTYFFAIIEVMSKRHYFGELELMILLSVLHLGDEAYGVPVVRDLEQRCGREVSLGSIYASLERLEARGMVASRLGDPVPERGGKARRYFRVTKAGMRQLGETRRVLAGLWQELAES